MTSTRAGGILSSLQEPSSQDAVTRVADPSELLTGDGPWRRKRALSLGAPLEDLNAEDRRFAVKNGVHECEEVVSMPSADFDVCADTEE